MSALKDYSILDIEAIDDERFKKEKAPGKWVPESRVYLKSEADKVIAELEESHKKEVVQLLILNREQAISGNKLRDSMEQALRHQKYKRCLAMAKWCRLKRLDASDYRIPREKWEFYDKWYKCWLKIAEQFKEAK